MEDINQAVANYLQKWDAFVSERDDVAFFKNLKPTAIGWKVEDLAEFDSRLAAMRDAYNFAGIRWLNERWIAKIILKEKLPSGIQIVKLMQRRPGSTDATGLDHLDFYYTDARQDAEALLKKENVKWNYEKNLHGDWYSVWFAAGEAKLRDETVIDVFTRDLQDFRKEILV